MALAGVKSLTIQEDKICKIADLSTQYFIKESDVKEGKSRYFHMSSNLRRSTTLYYVPFLMLSYCFICFHRVDAGLSRLSELNPHVAVKAIIKTFQKEDNSWDFLKQYKVTVNFYSVADILLTSPPARFTGWVGHAGVPPMRVRNSGHVWEIQLASHSHGGTPKPRFRNQVTPPRCGPYLRSRAPSTVRS